MPCAKIGDNLTNSYQITVLQIFHQIRIAKKKFFQMAAISCKPQRPMLIFWEYFEHVLSLNNKVILNMKRYSVKNKKWKKNKKTSHIMSQTSSKYNNKNNNKYNPLPACWLESWSSSARPEPAEQHPSWGPNSRASSPHCSSHPTWRHCPPGPAEYPRCQTCRIPVVTPSGGERSNHGYLDGSFRRCSSA